MTRYGTRRGRSRRYSLGLILIGWVAIGMTIVLVSGTLWAYAKYRSLWEGINHQKITDTTGVKKLNNAMNILLIGSDSRSGKNAKIGGYVGGQRSDTVMVVHISPRARGITVLSFPRDTVVPIYKCPAEPGGFSGQAAAPASVEQLNSSFAYGGANCLWNTLEKQTGIHLDNFIQLNFTGFISVINAIGGVPVCTPVRIRKTYYDKLALTPGWHVLNGWKALEWWRLREDFGLGSDLQRIQRDQLLMVGLVQKILKTGVLHSFTKTWSIINGIVKAHALTTDTGLTPSRLVHIALSLRGVSRHTIQFIEVPTLTYPNNPNWVEFNTSKTPKLFAAIQRDHALPKTAKGKKPAKGGAKSKQAKLLKASSVTVNVLNGSGVHGIAGTTSTALASRGFHIGQVVSATTASGSPDFNYTKSVVEYAGSAQLAGARTVAAQLPGKVILKQVSATSLPAGKVTLILGSDFTKLGPPPAHKVGNLSGKFGGYKASTNPCKGYGTAFTGSGQAGG